VTTPQAVIFGGGFGDLYAAINVIGIRSGEPMVLPGVTEPAIQEGKYVSRLIRRRVTNRPVSPPFWYWDKGDLAIAGRTYAVADLRLVRFWGTPA